MRVFIFVWISLLDIKPEIKENMSKQFCKLISKYFHSVGKNWKPKQVHALSELSSNEGFIFIWKWTTYKKKWTVQWSGFFLKIQLVKVSTIFLLMKADFNHNVWLFKPLQMVWFRTSYIWYNSMTICNLLNALSH